MLSSAAGNATTHNAAAQDRHAVTRVLTQRIWLPKLVYDSLPYFYILSGLSAFFATIYITEWFWVVPHYVLFSFACLHLGFYVHRRRQTRSAESEDAD